MSGKKYIFVEKLQKHGARSAKKTFFVPKNIENMETQANRDAGDRLPRGCRIIDFPEFMDARGGLSFAESEGHVPFAVERVFWLYNLSGCHSRGGHSHGHCAQVVIAVHGAFDLLLDDGTTRATIHLDSPHRGVLIAPTVWDELKNFSEGTVVMVMASHHFDAEDYISDYEEYRGELVELKPYSSSLAAEWDAFVDEAKNGTFLYKRGYMDYHADRFVDCSLMFYKKGELIGQVPASWNKGRRTVTSHGGLTYGGMLLSEKTTTVDTLNMMHSAAAWFAYHYGAREWLYKPLPYIYSRVPGEEDLYALFRVGGQLVGRSVASVISCDHRISMRTLRKRCLARSRKSNLTYEECDEWNAFWPLLREVLRGRHDATPVHSLEEMQLLASRFPNNIRLFVARHEGHIVAGAVVYESETVAHAQYLAVSEEGVQYCALDGLIVYLAEEHYAEKAYVDLGTSMVPGTSQLNEGLVFQKEGFGARTVVYDTYSIRL